VASEQLDSLAQPAAVGSPWRNLVTVGVIYLLCVSPPDPAGPGKIAEYLPALNCFEVAAAIRSARRIYRSTGIDAV
jgi:hypothetical protein